ncbi:MAG: ABC transporter substrate-binding protein [Synergistaceae bacterium]|jgi:peptide/nickel transport system substrate-binding protein|nr:ABC transporter substrate-binding protein [Synergistaceae bacterium]
MKKIYFAGMALALILGVCLPAAAKDALVVADPCDVATMDPIGHDTLASDRACNAIYDTLICRDPTDDRAVPGLAESWEILSGTEYKLHLRKGVTFHNGEEMKAEDVRYSLLRAKTGEYFRNLDDVEIVDDYAVIVRLKNADYSFLPFLSHNWSSIVNKKAVEAAGDSYGTNPVGTGPFKFTSWRKGDKYVLERFDDYWGPKPKYKTLEVRSIPEPSRRMRELESGQVDIAFSIADENIKRVEKNDNLILYRVPQSSVGFLGFNCKKKPLDDVRVRRAIFSALDVASIHSGVWSGVGKVPKSLFPEPIRYSIDAEIAPHVQDAALAQSLLDEAGVKNLKLEIWTDGCKKRVDIAAVIRLQLQKIGIAADVKVLEGNLYLNQLKENTHDLFIMGWPSPILDPNFSASSLLETGAEHNHTLFSDAKLDELLRKGRGTPDGDERAAIYKEMQLYLNEQLPMIYLYAGESIVGAQNYVKGFKPSFSENHSFLEVYFD